MGNILGQLVKRLDEQTEEVEYDPSCAYEMKINQALAQAGVRSPYSGGGSATFCFGTDAGADGEFTSAAGVVYNLEMKNGPGQSRAEPDGEVWKEALALVETVKASNTAARIRDILLAQSALGIWKGLTSQQPIVLSDNDLDLLAAKIAELQAPGIESILGDLRSKSETISYAPLYYYFGRTGNAEDDLGMSPEMLHPMSVTSALDVGAWVSHYNSSDTYYVQVGKGGGLYYMGSDPAGLGVPNFLSSAKLTSRVRFHSSSSKSKLGTFVTEAGQEIKITGRRFTCVPMINLSSVTKSPIDLDDEIGIMKLKSKLGYSISESKIRKTLLSSLMTEGITRGDVYEQTLVDAINAEASARGTSALATIQTATKYDLDVSDGQKSAKIEVKLDQGAQLGKVYKDMWKDLKWDIAGKQIVGTPKDVGERARGAGTLDTDNIEAGLLVLNTINSSPNLRKRMELLAQWYLQGDPSATEIDMTTSWPFIGGRPSASTLKKSPKAKDTTVPGTLGNRGNAKTAAQVAAGIPPLRQVSSSGDDLKVVLAAAEVASLFEKVNYIIIGDGNETQVSGMVARTGTNSLGNQIPAATFSDSNIEARWKSNSSNQDPYRWSMETRSSAGTSGGSRFENAAELYDLLFPATASAGIASTGQDLELNSTQITGDLLKELLKGI